ncbi:MAG: tail fiber domain-containing protein [Bacteroidetes bacterium]|nr:tail fiber domain-containing protein [Bacteroidota bacterium]
MKIKIKITISLLALASFLFEANVVNAQTCGSSQVTYSGYTSGYLPKWNATSGCISNSSIFDNGEVGIGLTAPASRLHSAGQIRSGIPSGGLGGASATTGSLLFYNSSNTNTVNIQSGVTTTSYTLTLPATQGAASSVLTNNGSGGLDWAQLTVGSWLLAGNTLSGTLPASPTEFIGTLNAADWIIRTNNTEKMRVQSSGNVGIGTTAPLATLQLKAATSKEFQFGNTAGAYTSSTYFTDLTTVGPIMNFSRVSDGAFVNSIFNYTGTGSLDQLGIASRNDIVFVSSNSPTTTIKENMRITGGNVGIGTSAPATKLHITGDAASVDLLKLQNTNGTTPRSYRIGPGAGIAAGFGIYDDNAAATRMVIDFSGNVGIGTTAPTALLSVNGDANKTGSATWGSFCDIRLKKDTSAFTDGLEVIKKIHPISYKYNGKMGIKDTNSTFIGVVAQQMQQAVPYTVETFMAKLDTADAQETQLLSYNPNALFYLFVNAFKELDSANVKKDSAISGLNQKITRLDSINTVLQNQLITSTSLLQNQLIALQTTINNCCNNPMQSSVNNNGQTKSMNVDGGTTQNEAGQIDVRLNDAQSIVLEQNVPNPFAEQTTISYSLPDNTVKAQILFYNSQGKLIQSTELIQKGKGQLNVFASDLSNGIYTYTLVVDGKVIDSKRMIKSK